MNHVTCKDCFYWLDNGLVVNEHQYGHCYYEAPPAAPQGNIENYGSRRPTTNGDIEFCGRFKWAVPYVIVAEANDSRILLFDSIRETKINYNASGAFVKMQCWTEAGMTAVTDKDSANRILVALGIDIVIP